MGRKAVTSNGNHDFVEQEGIQTDSGSERCKEEIEKLNRMLGAVLNYLADETIEEIDIDSLLNNTEGLKEWWDQYRERNRKQIEEEIKQSLSGLTLEELEKIRNQIATNKV
jgi:hypothetical protein